MEGQKDIIMHLIPNDEWNKQRNNAYLYPDSLKTEGFIHCATRDQVMGAIEFLYKEKIDLKLLCIDTNLVNAQIVYEDLYKTGEDFPHIYGALDRNAVIEVIDFKPNERGIFEIPVFN